MFYTVKLYTHTQSNSNYFTVPTVINSFSVALVLLSSETLDFSLLYRSRARALKYPSLFGKWRRSPWLRSTRPASKTLGSLECSRWSCLALLLFAQSFISNNFADYFLLFFNRFFGQNEEKIVFIPNDPRSSSAKLNVGFKNIKGTRKCS